MACAVLRSLPGPDRLRWNWPPVLRTGRPAPSMCTPQTGFQVASVSKQFVAAAVMLLAESGMVALGEPVDRWLPGSQWRRGTLHHLLTHTSGIGHWGDAPGFDPAQPMYPDDRLALIEQAPLRTEPGTRWHYSSPGYLLAGQIVARGSGRPYADFVTERILDPLELTSTTAGSVRSSAAIARGYRDRALVPPWDLSEMPGTGDICSTVGDVARVSAAVHSGSLLTGSSRRALRAVHTPLSGDQGSGDDWLTGYGYGLFIGKICGHAAYLQPGDVPGYKSFSAWLPEHAASIVILANNENVDMENLLRQLLPAASPPTAAASVFEGRRFLMLGGWRCGDACPRLVHRRPRGRRPAGPACWPTGQQQRACARRARRTSTLPPGA